MRHPRNITVDGLSYDLSHLFPRDYSYTLPADKENPDLDVEIVFFFSNHCYTESVPDGETADPILYDHNNNPRKFCSRRYELSLILIQSLDEIYTKKCLFTGKQNWLIIDRLGENGEVENYHVYFNIQKHHKKRNCLVIRIESAYIKDRPGNTPKRGGRHDRVRFALLARKTLKGESVRRPRRK